MASADAGRVPPRVVQRVVLDYLVHHGHLNAASAFMNEAGCDGNMQLSTAQREHAAALQAPASQPHIVLHRQRAEHIAHVQYRHTCYEQPQVAERLAIMALYDGWRWLSVNFYRGTEHGVFDDDSLRTIAAFAPLVVQAVRLHYAGRVIDLSFAAAFKLGYAIDREETSELGVTVYMSKRLT